MYSPERPFERKFLRIEKLRNITLALLFAAVGLVYLGAQRFTPKLYDRTYEDLCSSASPTILFEPPHDRTSEKQLRADLDKLPVSVVNVLGRDRYKVVLVAGVETVRKRYSSPLTDSRHIGGFTNLVKKEIVIKHPDDFRHEVAHAVDYAFGHLSLSETFLKPIAQQEQQYSVDLMELRDRYIKNLNVEQGETKKISGDIIAMLDELIGPSTKLHQLRNLPDPLRRFLISSDYALLSYVEHRFVEGFREYYYPTNEHMTEAFRRDHSELYTAFNQLDTNLRKYSCK